MRLLDPYDLVAVRKKDGRIPRRTDQTQMDRLQLARSFSKMD